MLVLALKKLFIKHGNLYNVVNILQVSLIFYFSTNLGFKNCSDRYSLHQQKCYLLSTKILLNSRMMVIVDKMFIL